MIAKVNTLTKKITFTAGPYPNASGDDLVQKLDFVIDRFTGNGVDLGESDIYIYYTNGRGDTYSHPILSSSITRDDLFLRFRWDFAKEVSEVSGTTLFSICAKKESNGKYITEWNSEKASLPVIKSIGNREVKDFDSTSYQEVEGMLAESESKVNGKIAMFSTEITEKMAEFENDVDGKVYAAEQYKELSSNYRYLSESYAKGTMNDEPTPYGDAGYNDNSKYYKGFAEAYAKGTVDGTAVESGQPGYQDNAKYYKEQVEASANQIAINTARIDQIESLPGGSTSLDAEVVDIRVKADGQSATTAGNAVREQVTELRNLVTETTYNATLWAQGTPPASTNTTFIMTSDPINGKYVGAVVPSGKYVLLFAKNGSTKVGYYRAANDTFVGSVASATQYTEGSPIFEEIFAAYPTYTWYFVARFTAEGAISPSDGATVGLISNRIDIIDNEVLKSTYYGKTLSILGDSISTFDGYIPEGNLTYYPSGTVQNVTDTWWKKLIDALDMELLVNNSWSGSRVTTTSGETSAGCMTRCQSLGTAPDVIIVYMGINDFNNEVALGTYDGKTEVPVTTTTFREAYGIMLNKILTAYPSSEVWVCTLPQCERNGSSGFPEVNGNNVSLLDFNNAIVELANAFGVKVLDHNKCGLTYQNMSVYNPDNLHPTKYGHSLIANNDIRQMDNFVRIRYAIGE